MYVYKRISKLSHCIIYVLHSVPFLESGLHLSPKLELIGTHLINYIVSAKQDNSYCLIFLSYYCAVQHCWALITLKIGKLLTLYLLKQYNIMNPLSHFLLAVDR